MIFTPQKWFKTAIICLLTISTAYAQYNQSPILPNLEKGALYDALVENYKPDNVLEYDFARDTLFKNVYQFNDSLYCVYTSHRLYLDPDEDPTSYVYRNGQSDGINTEHSYPRSKGARYGNAKSDMHHLFPTRIPVNAKRSNFPYGNIRDQETEIWYYKEEQQSSIPNDNINAYSEYKMYRFEPREAFKGNIARAIFYFYTMYRQKAVEEDDLFFDSQRKTLCEWHENDPVDSLEFVRTHIISQYQDDKVNPFIIDCTLAERLYCDDVTQTCEVTTATEESDLRNYSYKILGNPVDGNLIRIQMESPEAGYWEAELINAYGQVLKSEKLDYATDFGELNFQVNSLPKGSYFIQLKYKKEPSGKSLRLPTKTVLIH